MTAKLVEAACDWLTATSTDQAADENMQASWSMMLEEISYPRTMIRKSAWQGYFGWRIEQGFFGTRKDGSCVILSGHLASRYARQWVDMGARPSRVDFQLTGQPGGNLGAEIEKMFEAAKRYKSPVSKPPNLKMWVGRGGPEGLYVGSRQSEVMLRIYDKARESRQAEYAGCLRVEVEIKKESARRYAGQWLTAESERAYIMAVVKGLTEARGLSIPFEVTGPGVVLRKTSSPTPIESKLAWLKQQVSPTLLSLIEEIGWGEIMGSILPDSVDKHAHDDSL